VRRIPFKQFCHLDLFSGFDIRASDFPWLAERVASEQPFIGYHATVALARAVRSQPPMSVSDLAAVLTNAREFLSERRYKDPNQEGILRNAEADLAARGADDPQSKSAR
jgi:hypothetical protein